ncbi:tumor susceptibility gene 101 protein-like isoform X1 [Watersipora subatra]|uniref:tumor susceptibility gene 101 protein-like isoform X1 n=1 Tax=Watersipora subatra TaxID=2589382 RepID=UPI00355C3DAD
MPSDADIRNLLISYKYNSQAFADIRAVTKSFTSLQVFKKQFVYRNGESKQLVCLDGTIPIKYKAKTYNIPIIIWTHETHPYNAPLVFVQPTATMNIKAGKHVDQSGSVTIPYLNEWRYGQSDTHTLVSVLCMVFGEEPPVFAKSKTRAPPPVPSANQSATQNQLPYPISAPNMPQHGGQYPGSSTATGYPSVPPYPTYTPGYTNTSSSSVAPQGYPSYGTPQQPPYQTTAPTTTAASIGGYPGMLPYPPGPATTGSTGYPSAQPATSYPPASTAAPYSTTTPYPPYPTNNYTNPPPTTGATDQSGVQRQKSFGLSEEEIKESLRSALKDRVRRRLKEILEANKAEMDVLRKTQEDLTNGKGKLEAMAKAIEEETAECQTSINLLTSAIPEIKAQIEKKFVQSEFLPEEAIETTAPVYRQLLQTYSEEQAIEDTLYILGDALRKETIGIELYLKKVRDLSTRQFMLKALTMKCREKAGLSDL